MQNLTARYNILYNARILVDESERNLFNAYRDNFDLMLPVFRESTPELAQPEVKNLDKAIEKMNVIVNEKAQSDYIDDAYFLIARANHLKGEFFNSVEFFDYVYTQYTDNDELRQMALAWKTRALIKLNRFDEARSSLDTAIKYIEKGKRAEADVYALAAQLSIHADRHSEAEELLKKAIKETDLKRNRLRWYYLLAQLQERNGRYEQAYDNYINVIKSNAPFDMAFNATLSRITIEDKLQGSNSTRADRLAALLRQDKNLQFADQIYFEIAQSYLEQDQTDKAITNFNTSIRNSTKNPEQKARAYLSLADIYFRQRAYVKSKAYYDSTLLNLTLDYPGYEQIKKKSDNLHLLSDRLSIIAREDTLQMLARLPESERTARIGILARAQAQDALAQSGATNIGDNLILNAGTSNSGSTTDGKFYFDNTTAIGQGFSDFKRRWGNRKLEDNWRRSQRSAVEVTNTSNATALNPDDVVTGNAASAGQLNRTGNGQIDMQNIPLTPALIAASNQRISQAYFDIGDFYKDILNEPAEAVKAYEELLRRNPDAENKLAVYYNLYRLNMGRNPTKAEEYKNLLLIQYPESPFAKTIRDPNYKQMIDEEQHAATRFYEEMYDNYIKRNYPQVILQADKAKQQFSTNSLSSQISYLGALAIGHTSKLQAFEKAISNIITEFPDDKLIVPLAEQHLLYINRNRPELGKRDPVLPEYDPEAPRFVEEPEQPQLAAEIEEFKSPTPEVKQPATDKPAVSVQNTILAESSMFTIADSSVHYFVVNVLDSRANLNSSRFGIGQFNRTNFAGNSIKHRLKTVNNQNQLIFVGEFIGRDAAMDYQKRISHLMKDIMKVPTDKYSTFIITKNNLDKLNDRQLIEEYIEFYQKNY